MSGLLDEAEKKRLQEQADKSQEHLIHEVEDARERDKMDLKQEIRYLVDKLQLDKAEIVANIGAKYGGRHLRQLTKEELTDIRNGLKGRDMLGEQEVKEVDREAHEVLENTVYGALKRAEKEQQQGSAGELVPTVTGAVVPVLTEEEAITHFQRFQHLKSAVLTDADYMFIGKDGKPCKKGEHISEYIKKSGWRKIALIFNISIELRGREWIEGTDRDGQWHGWLYKVVARAPKGRVQEAEGVCTTRNKFFCRRYNEANKKSEWVDTDEKNLICTAQTVAINRAISDLVGSGELSAEEVE